MVHKELKTKKYSPLGKGLLNYLNFTSEEKQAIGQYLLGNKPAPFLRPKITRQEIQQLERLLRQLQNENGNPVLQEWVDIKGDELKLLKEYLQFLEDGRQAEFRQKIFAHYGQVNKDIYHFHINNLLQLAAEKHRSQIMAKELKGL